MTLTYSDTLATNYSNGTPGTYNLASIQWPGGQGTFSIIGNFNGATATLQMLGPDNSTWLNVGVDTTKVSNGIGNFSLSPCTLRLSVAVVSTVSGIYANIARVIY